MQLPVELIDYVIVHELCHFVEHNHSAAYYEVLSSVMPDWEERRSRLKQSRVH
jgi:predicted metal-dependent hydrolase